MENKSASIRHRSGDSALMAVLAALFAAAPSLRAANWTLPGDGTMTDGEWTLAVSGPADALSTNDKTAFWAAFPGERKPYGRAASSTIPANQWVAIVPEPHTILIVQ